ncbi:MAG: Stp1/IreP family PP2C-type Ser/Thr phosphatase [Parachlamydiaceae bacterium]|nr:Stp1/IreP family PP2C-type Ser/Thr phosphatase [Parachlamydiaceae bacterium]
MVLNIMSYKILVSGLSDVGLVRQNNEDVWGELPEEQFFVLADGMGGHQAGEIASRQAVDNLCRLFKEKFNNPDISLNHARQLIEDAIREVNRIVFKMGYQQEKLHGMGTTLCCIYLHKDGLVYGHVGDSRIYRLRNHTLKQLTHDHSLVRELIELGQIKEEQAGEFLYKNIITKAIGTEPEVKPSVKIDELLVGDVILMCTDGLTDLLNFQEIQMILQQKPDKEMASSLVKFAKMKGGFDNITVVVVKIQGKM